MLRKLFKLIDAVGMVSFGLYAVQQVASALMPAQRLPESRSGAQLTFLVPALNEAQVIEATVENLRATAPDAEVVVIDDASDDGTDGIVRRLAALDPSVHGQVKDWATDEGSAKDVFELLLVCGFAELAADWVMKELDVCYHVRLKAEGAA